MQLTLLGTGTPWPSATRQPTANLVSLGKEHLLVDAGRSVTTQIARLGMHPKDVDHIFITHHHFDHISGLDDFLLSAWNDGRTEPVRIYGPPGTRHIIETLFRVVYKRDIQFRLLEAKFVKRHMPAIEDLFLVEDIESGTWVESENWRIRCGAVEHGHAMGLSQDEWPCFGYRIEAEGKVLTISGDTVDCEGVRALAQGADTLLQCCYLPESAVDDVEKRVLVDLVLASATQANAIARACGAARLVLTHLSPRADAMQSELMAEAGFDYPGEVTIGQDLMTIKI
jgi:ribonuclease Z